jgi:hypothetical protein
VALVDGGYAVVAVGAGSVVTELLAGRQGTVRAVGAVVLTVIALRGLLRLRQPSAPLGGHRAAADGVPGHSGAPGPGRPGVGTLQVLGRFVALTAVNPMTAVYFTVLAAGLAATAGLDLAEGAQATAFVVGILVGSLAWQLVLATIGAAAGGRVTRRVRVAISAAGYVVVLGYAVVLLRG